ncbi:MAG: tRNA adenosine deaminase-associated protein [Actinomycetota bacterium]|nr:tRNA adenosine deaminase-associated protein [Actinomycetota bacterium]
MPYLAVSLARTERGWTARELDLGDVEDLDTLTDLLRDAVGDGPGPGLLLLEENDEYLAVVRVDDKGDPRVFLSDRRAVGGSEVASLLADADLELPDPDEESNRPAAEPAGDAGLLADLGTSGERLLVLCTEEGLLPADVLTALAEDCGFVEELEQVRGA